ncbi:MAG: universal stress protein [Microbacteriaceae bacterium]
MTDDAPSHRGPIVVGVAWQSPAAVIRTAADFARRFEAELVCAFVDESVYQAAFAMDGMGTTIPMDVELAAEVPVTVPEEVEARIAETLGGTGIPWSARALEGDPARELAELAERVDAPLIVVGSRHPGVLGSVREFFAGSIAARLAHIQPLPVVVVPLTPVARGGALPWTSEHRDSEHEG